MKKQLQLILKEIKEFRKIDDAGNGYDAAVRALDNIEKIVVNDLLPCLPMLADLDATQHD